MQRTRSHAPVLAMLCLVLSHTGMVRLAMAQPGLGGGTAQQVNSGQPGNGGSVEGAAATSGVLSGGAGIQPSSLFSANTASTLRASAANAGLPNVEEFLASLGTGANLQAISNALAQLPYDDYLRLQSYLITIGTLELNAFTAIPVPLIGLVSVGLGIGAAVLATIGGALYATAAAVGLYAAITGVVTGKISECKALATTPATDTTETTSAAAADGAEPKYSPPPAKVKEEEKKKDEYKVDNKKPKSPKDEKVDQKYEAAKKLPPLDETYVEVNKDKKVKQDEELDRKYKEQQAKKLELCRKINIEYPTKSSGIKLVLEDIIKNDPEFANLEPMVAQAYDSGRYVMPYMFSDGPESLNDDLELAEAVLSATLASMDKYAPKN